jgi:hypothetical protein
LWLIGLSPAGPKDWFHGDWNYDNLVDGQDRALWLIGLGQSPLPSPPAGGGGASMSAVPEPSTIALLICVGLAGLLFWKKNRV